MHHLRYGACHITSLLVQQAFTLCLSHAQCNAQLEKLLPDMAVVNFKLDNIRKLFSSVSKTQELLNKGWLSCYRNDEMHSVTSSLRSKILPWAGSSVGWSVILMHSGCGFDPWSGYIQGSTDKCISKWNNKSVSLYLALSFSFSPSLLFQKSINKK